MLIVSYEFICYMHLFVWKAYKKQYLSLSQIFHFCGYLSGIEYTDLYSLRNSGNNCVILTQLFKIKETETDANLKISCKLVVIFGTMVERVLEPLLQSTLSNVALLFSVWDLNPRQLRSAAVAMLLVQIKKREQIFCGRNTQSFFLYIFLIVSN